MGKLNWPPTAYGKSLFDHVLAKVRQGQLTKDQAKDLLDAWFDAPEAG
jgi:hypothetical protein